MRDSHRLFEMIYSIWACPLPVIARVNGDAFGGGAGLVAACDMAFAVDHCRFGFTECKLGLIPAVISPFVMSRIGRTHASRYFLTAERFGSAEAQRIGLVQNSHADLAGLDAEVERVIGEIANNSPQAVRSAPLAPLPINTQSAPIPPRHAPLAAPSPSPMDGDALRAHAH